MLDRKQIMNDPEKYQQLFNIRKHDHNVEAFTKLIQSYNKDLSELSALRSKSKTIGRSIANGVDLLEDAQELKALIAQKESHCDILYNGISIIESRFPNVLHESVPIGEGAENNVVIKQIGDCFEIDTTYLDIMKGLDTFSKISSTCSGNGFPIYYGPMASMIRSFANDMMDWHISMGHYTEVNVPAIVNKASMYNAGNLPKFEDDLFEIDGKYLIPTSEVPLTTEFKDCIFTGYYLEDLRFACSSLCFRREAGSAGQKDHGIIRTHQFEKVELMEFCLANQSYDRLDKMVDYISGILERFEVTHRIVLLCSGETSHKASKCYDIEVWCPGLKRWLEVSSVSNFETYQTRRANIRYRSTPDSDLEYLHTINGSGVAIPRFLIAYIESHFIDNELRFPQHIERPANVMYDKNGSYFSAHQNNG